MHEDRPAQEGDEQRMQRIHLGNDRLAPQERAGGPQQAGADGQCPLTGAPADQVSGDHHSQSNAERSQQSAQQVAKPGRVRSGK